MKIDLTEAMAVDFYDWNTEVPLEMEHVSFKQGDFDILKKTPVKVQVHHTKGGQVQVSGTVETTIAIPCDRCLKPVSCGFSIDAERELDLSQEDQPSYVEGTVLDVDGLIFHELLLHWPAKTLCRKDCKGICPVCGADLNEGECGCDRQVLDPRMAAIQDIFNNFQS